MSKKTRRRIGNALATGASTLIGILFFAPFAWMVSSSFKDISEIYDFPPKFIPQQIKWSNYADAWNALPFDIFFLNSAIVAVATTVGVILTCSLAGYSFARLRYPGRDKIFLAYLATMMIPFPVLMVPLFVIMKNLQLVDTLWSLILPAVFTPAGTFLMRQFILTLPRELEEAARVDGCGFFGIYWRIVLPLMKPVIATLAIFTFLGSWNEFLWPLISISSIDQKTLPLGLTMFQSRLSGRTPWNQVMASATFTIIPVLVLFILGQKYYVKGIVTTGIKG
ncbi:multiple sugar transport system permease protein [Microlunatus panaciterrae]|uniref:Multiple sugar transport system permease protein n=1 Tax=Microlunatus panaciterrae TaxID=400768 RepID=A0ABS2RKC6_9ACTN|nr:carbohydrate ABC transporter permease [Microlunatus panaciterrae]MBM7799466.1 multiple sugar transport system permease protein [Microlunatus panaciterrae]